MQSFLQVSVTPSDDAKDKAALIGYVCTIMMASEQHLDKRVAYLRRLVSQALEHQTIKIYFNPRGDPVGYVIWAHVAPDTEKRFFETGVWELHLSEWNEGMQTWVLDFAAPFGNVRQMLVDLRDVVFAEESCIRYFRIKSKRAISKEISLASNVSFLKPRKEAGHTHKTSK